MSLPRWLRKDAWIADAPAGDLGSLDIANGMGRRISDDAPRACKGCGWTPHAGERVVGECVPGYHDIALVGWPTADERRDGWLPSERQERLSREDDAPVGEVPPEHVQRTLAGPSDAQATRIMRDLFHCCPVCGWLPEGDGHVLTHHPSGAHYVTYGEDTRVHVIAAEKTFDEHADEAIALVSPWSAADQQAAAEMGVEL